MTTGSWMRAIRPAIGPALDEPPTAPKPLSLDDLAKNIVRARNLRVEAVRDHLTLIFALGAIVLGTLAASPAAVSLGVL